MATADSGIAGMAKSAMNKIRDTVVPAGSAVTDWVSDHVPNFPFSRPHTHAPPEEYARMRKSCPFAKAKMWDGSEVTLVTRHKDVCDVLQDNRYSKVRTHPNFPEMNPGGKEAVKGMTPTFVDMDPPQHTKYRGMVASWFTRERAEAMRPSIQAKADALAQEVLQKGKGTDLSDNFSMPLAFKVIYEMIGIPFADYQFLSNCVAVRSSGSSTSRDASAAASDLNQYMEKLVSSKESNPADDIISDLIQNQLKPGNMTREELVQTSFLLLVAGNATVAGQINLGVITLLEHPDQLKKMKDNPDQLIPSAVDEVLRYHTASAYALRRVAKEDVTYEGGAVVIKKDSGVVALNQSANRDESVFSDPDTFDITRNPNPHLGFGYGIHLCPGEWLSRVEMEAAFRALFINHIPNLRLAEPFDKVQYSDPSKDVGVKALPVTW